MTDQRAKDLAAIEPPSSMRKIVEFTEQLSFGQDALFAGTELPKPHIGQGGIEAAGLAKTMASNPYQFFPGVGSEGLDAVMARHAIRSRDIQDFTRWLMKWDAKRSELVVFDSPEQVFYQHATPELVEHYYDQNPELERIIVEGRRRQVVQEEVITEEVEVQQVRRTKKSKRVEEQEKEQEEGQEQSRKRALRQQSGEIEEKGSGQFVEKQRNLTRRHPKPEPQAEKYDDYWREQSPRMEMSKGAMRAVPVSAAAGAAPMGFAQSIAGINQSIITSNMGFGGLATGVIRGQADATNAYQAQEAASQAVQQSPVAQTYMPPQQQMMMPGQSQMFGRGLQTPPQQISSHYPAPEVAVSSQPLRQYRPAGTGTGTGTGVGAASPYGETPAASYGPMAMQGAAPGYGLSRFGTTSNFQQPEMPVSQQELARYQEHAQSRSFNSPAHSGGEEFVVVPRSVAMKHAVPVAQTASLARPGFTGAASQHWAGDVAMRAMMGTAGMGVPMMIGDGSVMPGGSVPRKDVMGMGFVAANYAEPMTRGFASGEPTVQTGIPNNPLMGQITLMAPPVRVASQASEQAGSAVSIDIKQLAKGAGAVDATSLAMLKSAMPGGIQAIYPALPQSQLGAQAVNMKLAPSLLSQILSQGYGAGAASMAPSFAAAASTVSLGNPIASPMEASIVPTLSRPVGDQAGVFGSGKETEKSFGQIGAAGASRGGALDFLGMPVRLAPSLAGNPEISQEAEARKVLPPGAAAVMRPNEFAPLKSKLFPAFGSVQAEPDKKAWDKAAPSFGLKGGHAASMLSPDARLKPLPGGAALPQVHSVSASPMARALSGAAEVSAVAGAIMPSMGAGGLHALSSHAAFGGTAAEAGPSSFGFGGGGAVPLGLGSLMGGGTRAGRHAAVPSIGSAMSLVRPAPIGFGGFPRISGAASFGAGFSAPAQTHSAPAAGGMNLGHRVASRWSAPHPGSGSLGLPSMSEAGPSGPPAMPTMKTHTRSGSAARPGMPSMRAGTPAQPDTTASISSSAPAMARPTIPTTAGAHPGIRNLSSPAPVTPSATESSASVLEKPSRSGMTSYKPPEMPIASSIVAKSPTGASSFVQRSVEHGLATSQGSAIQEPDSTGGRVTKDPGANAHDVNMLANEVWSLLKRKLTFESERMGRR